MRLTISRPLTVLALLTASILSACDIEGALRDKTPADWNDMTWTEDVSLQSGETLKVRRHVKFRQPNAWGAGGIGAAIYTEASIEMVGEPQGFVRWSAPIRPIHIDKDPDNQEWIVIGGLDASAFWSINGEPCPPQWAFRLHDGIWYVQPVPENIIGRTPNLLMDLRVTDDREYDSAQFNAVAAGRKAIQFSDQRVSQEDLTIGATGQFSMCKDMKPQFRREFIPHATDRPNLGNFPRMPGP